MGEWLIIQTNFYLKTNLCSCFKTAAATAAAALSWNTMTDYLLKDYSYKSDDLLRSVQEKDWNFTAEMWNELPQAERDWIFMEFRLTPPSYYEERLKAMDFTGKKCVIDAACGYGRWTLPLAKLNHFVHGIDIHPQRLSMAGKLLENHGKSNAEMRVGNLENLPFDADFADGVFCYSVIMFTNIDNTIREFNRVLKKGGLLYLNYNNIGWYLHLLLDRAFLHGEINLIKPVVKYALNTLLNRRRDMIITSAIMTKLLTGNGFKVLAESYEGGINLNGSPNKILPVFKPLFYNCPAVVEVLAEKK